MRFTLLLFLLLLAAPAFALTEQQTFTLGDNKFQQRDFPAVVTIFTQYLSDFPAGAHRDTVKYELAFAEYNVGQIQADGHTSDSVTKLRGIARWETLANNTADTATATWSRFQAGVWYAQQPGQLPKAVTLLEAVTAYPGFQQYAEASYSLMVAYSQQAENAILTTQTATAINRIDKAVNAAQEFMDATPGGYQWWGTCLFTQGVLLWKRCDLVPGNAGNPDRLRRVAANMRQVRDRFSNLPIVTDSKYYLARARYRAAFDDGSLSPTSKTVERRRALQEMQEFLGDDRGHGGRNLLRLDLARALFDDGRIRAAKYILNQLDLDTTATIRVTVPGALRTQIESAVNP